MPLDASRKLYDTTRNSIPCNPPPFRLIPSNNLSQSTRLKINIFVLYRAWLTVRHFLILTNCLLRKTLRNMQICDGNLPHLAPRFPTPPQS